MAKNVSQNYVHNLNPIDNGQIFSELDIPSSGNQISVDQNISDSELIDALNVYNGINFKISWLISYFKIDEGGNPYTSFATPLTITIYYEGLSWYLGVPEHYNRPRVAYLTKDADGWADHWVEFNNNQIKKAKPPRNGKPGEIVIEVDNLPDPLIGGC